jgi:Mg-chelatase subunit ChlI
MKKMTSKAKTQKDQGRVFDVARPGKSTPDSSSRPLIVGHRTMLKQDPMVSAMTKVPSDALLPKEEIVLSAPEIPEDPVTDKTPKKPAVRTIKVESSGKPVAEILMKKAAKAAAETLPVVEEPAVGVEEQEQPAPNPEVANKQEAEEVQAPKQEDSPAADEAASQEKPGEAGEEDKSSEEGEVGAVADKAGAKKAEEKAAEEAAAKQEAYEKLISEKKYFAPIGEKKRKRSMRLGLLLVVLLVFAVLAAGDLLIDAGVIKTSIKPPVRIFNSK